jgi:predicted HicB family RNase H-like nuclease
MNSKTRTRRNPSTPDTTGLLILRFPKTLRRRIHIRALETNTLMGEWIIGALQEAVERAEKRRS